MACMFYFARCINILFTSLLAQLVKYDVCTTRKIKFINTICYHVLLWYSTDRGTAAIVQDGRITGECVCVGVVQVQDWWTV